MSLLLNLALLALGLAVLIFSADALIRAAISLSQYMKLPSSIIGLTLIALGTSLPEIAVSGFAAWNDQSQLAIGNILGSNISNIALILAIAAIATPITYENASRNIDLPVLLGITALMIFTLVDGRINWVDGVLLALALVGYLALLRQTIGQRIHNDSSIKQRPLWQEVGILLLTLALLAIGCEIAIYAAGNIAREYGISDIVIGSTIVAIGSSLPELSVVIMGIRRGEVQLIIGNIIGSNIINIGMGLSLAALLSDTELPVIALLRDGLFMFGVTLWFAWLVLRNQNNTLGRWCGILLPAYTGYIFLAYWI